METQLTVHSDLLVGLADTTLNVARKLKVYSHHTPEIVALTPLECQVLLYIYQFPGVSPGDLSQQMALRSSNTASALRGLIRKNQVERRPNTSDRRAACLHITAAAEQAIVTVRNTWHELLSQAGISESELDVAVRVLNTINTSLLEP